MELADVLCGRDALTDVLARIGDHSCRRGLHSQDPQHEVRRHLEQPDERVADAGENIERDREDDRDRLRLLERDRLRHELSENYREVGEQCEGDDEADARGQGRLEQIGDQRLAHGADEDGEHRDSQLRARDEADRLVHEAECGARTPPAPLGALLQARPAADDERVLGGDEEGAAEDQQQDDDDAEKDAHALKGCIDKGRLRPSRGAGTWRDLVAHSNQVAV